MQPYNSTYVPKTASTASSDRVRAASVFSQFLNLQLSSAEKKKRTENDHNQCYKIESETVLCSPAPDNIKTFTHTELNTIHLVVDGSKDKHVSTLCKQSHPVQKNILSISIAHEQMYVPPIVQPSIGIRREDNDGEITFCLCPRTRALHITNLFYQETVTNLWNAFSSLERVQRFSIPRGKDKPVFGPYKYTGAMGWQPKRNGTGITSSYHYRKLKTSEISSIHSHIYKLEQLMIEYSSPQTVRMLQSAKSLMNWPTIGSCDVYSAIACGRNVYLSAHVDNDFTYSIVTIHSNLGSYRIDDEIVGYFCFPRIGTAVPLRPGDVLIFNAREPHCVSSRYNARDDILCLSVYLKSSIVGGNDNFTQPYSPRTLSALRFFQNNHKA